MPPRPVDLEAVEARLRKLEEADRFPGAVAVRQADQALLSGAFGYASRTWDVQMAPGMRFDSASITKVFTAVATLQLIEGGAFDLDTSAIEYLGLDGTGISTAVTPYHLLTHATGWRRNINSYTPGRRARRRHGPRFVALPRSVTESRLLGRC